MTQILFVCTGNTCRSPMAEALLRRRLAGAGVAAAVGSAGRSRPDQPADPAAQKAVAAYGADLSAHRSRALTPDMLREADLVIGMAREHVREAVTLEPSTWPKAFTLKELVRSAYSVGRRPVSMRLESWLAFMQDGRDKAQLLGRSLSDDIEDPVGQSAATFRERADEIARLIEDLVGYAWSREPSSPGG